MNSSSLRKRNFHEEKENSSNEDVDATGSSWSLEDSGPVKRKSRNRKRRSRRSTPLSSSTMIENSENSTFTRESNQKSWAGGDWCLPKISNGTPRGERKAIWKEFQKKFNIQLGIRGDQTEKVKLLAFKSKCSEWLQDIVERLTLVHEPQTVLQLMECIDKHFEQTFSAVQEKAEFALMTQKEDETFEDWSVRVTNKVKLVGYPEEYCKQAILNQMMSGAKPALKREMRMKVAEFGEEIEKYVAHGIVMESVFAEDEKDEKKPVPPSEKDETAKAVSLLAVQFGEYIRGQGAVSKGPRFGNYENREQKFDFRGRGKTPYDRSTPYDRYSQGDQRSFYGNSSSYGNSSKPCPTCGRFHQGECKAKHGSCSFCGKPGHFYGACEEARKLSKKVKEKNIQSQVNELNECCGARLCSVGRRDPRIIAISMNGVAVDVLIDSGSTVNAITEMDWEKIRKCKTGKKTVLSVQSRPQLRAQAYASESELKLVCSFEAIIEICKTERKTRAKFFVVRGANINLLSYETSTELGVLKVGLEINQVEALSGEFPKIPMEPIKIRIDESIAPKRITRVNLPKAYEKRAEERLEAMERRGIIEPIKGLSDITSISPMVVVPKGKNDFRIVVDYREVNKRIIREPHPLPQIDRILAQIPTTGDLCLTVLDLSDAFFHVELDKSARPHTAFMTSKGLMQFTRLPFGLSISPEAFQKTMDVVFSRISNVVVYLDDILVIAGSPEALEESMKRVNECIFENKLTINREKSKYNQTKVSFLGFEISKDGVKPIQKKIEQIQNYKSPTSMTQLRSFLGLLTFLQSFVKGFAEKVHVLRKKLKEAKFSWTEGDAKEFERIKEQIVKEKMMKNYFDPDAKTILYTDASPRGLGAVLVQCNKDGKEDKVVTYASKTLTKAESNYPQLHREALAIIWAMEKFTYYLLGRKFVLKCDCKALEFMIKRNESKADTGRRVLSRAEGWFLRMEPFDFDFQHVAGSENIADPASRMTADDEQATDFEESFKSHEICVLTAKSMLTHVKDIASEVLGYSTAELLQETVLDEELSLLKAELTNIRNCKKGTKLSESLKFYEPLKEEININNGLLLLNGKVIMPKALQTDVLSWAHCGHNEVTTMKKLIRAGIWWKGLEEDIEKFYKSCKACGMLEKKAAVATVNTVDEEASVWPSVISNKLIRAESIVDEKLIKVKHWLNSDKNWPEEIKAYKPHRQELIIVQEVLMKVYHRGGEQVKSVYVLPESLKEAILKTAHISHPGSSTMKRLIRKSLWWPGMDSEVEIFVRSCRECQLVTPSNRPMKIAQTQLPNKPWDFVSIDFSTASANEGWKALVLTDHYSRFLVAKQMHKTDAESVKKVLEKIFRTYYLPAKVQADNGPPFNSGPFREFLQEKGIILRNTTELNPTENGMVERKMQGINKISAIARLEKRSWGDALEEFVANYNSWPHAITGIAPADLMFGRKVRHNLPDSSQELADEADEQLRDADQVVKSRRNELEDKKRRALSDHEFAIGDLVLIRQEKKDKCDTIFKNSEYEIIGVKKCGEASLKEVASGKILRRNVKHIKLFKKRELKSKEPFVKKNSSIPDPTVNGPTSKEDQQDQSEVTIQQQEPERRSSRARKPNPKYVNSLSVYKLVEVKMLQEHDSEVTLRKKYCKINI